MQFVVISLSKQQNYVVYRQLGETTDNLGIKIKQFRRLGQCKQVKRDLKEKNGWHRKDRTRRNKKLVLCLYWFPKCSRFCEMRRFVLGRLSFLWNCSQQNSKLDGIFSVQKQNSSSLYCGERMKNLAKKLRRRTHVNRLSFQLQTATGIAG